MRDVPRAAWARYGIAMIAVLAAWLVRWSLDPMLGNRAEYPTFLVAVVFAAWYGGLRPALLALAGSLGIVAFFFLPRVNALAPPSLEDFLGLALFLFVGIAVALLSEAMRSALQRAEQHAEAAVRKQEQLEQEILERRQAETELWSQREWFRVTFSSIGDAVITTDTAGAITFMNPVAESLTGWRQAEAAGRPLDEVFQIENEVTREPVESPVARALLEGGIIGLANHTVLIARDGAEHAIDDSAAPIRDEHLQVRGVVLIFRDVTGARRAQMDRLRLAAIVDSSDDAIVLVDREGTIRTWNEGATRLYGYQPAEAVGRPLSMLVPPERAAELASRMERLRSGEQYGHYETVRLRKDGTPLEVSVSHSLVTDDSGAVIGVSTIARDIAREKQAEREIRRLNRDLQRRVQEIQTMLDVIPVGVAVTEDAEGRTLWPNAEMARILGLPGGLKVMPGSAETAFRLFRDGRELTPEQSPLHEALVTGREVRDFELDVLRADGTATRFLGYVAPLFDEAGKPRGAVVAGMDITQRRQAEEALREADRRKDEFLATLAHELRNPLAPIRTALETVRLAGDRREVLEEARGVMERQLQQMVRLVDDLLDLSRIGRGAVDLRRERVELAAVIRAALETCGPCFEQKSQHVVVELPEEPLPLDADPSRLAQVFGNLLNNACKFTPAGGRVRIAGARAGERVTVTVSDTGAGIAPAVLPHIFGLFTRAGQQSGGGQEGLGVGLSLVRGLVELHGGTVEARSDGPGRGSEFVVRLPLATAAARPEPRERPAPAIAGPACRVLVVDDNHDSADSLRALLEIMGHEAHAVYGPEEALRETESFRPELVLLDIGMPGMSGYEVAKRLREQSHGRQATLVAVTGWGQEEDRRRAREAGFDTHMTKPVDPKALQQLLQQRQSGALASGAAAQPGVSPA